MAPVIYHVMSRGVDKRLIFQEDKDYLRFINDLYEFNNLKPTVNNNRSASSFVIDVKHQSLTDRDQLVELYAFCLMPNHYHLLLTPIRDDGMSKFMQKLNGGYVKYFNLKYSRKGRLFESTYKPVTVESESHFIYLPYYIHCNPLDLEMAGWRTRSLPSPKAAWQFLETYRWSSHLDYLGRENFPSVTDRTFLLSFFGETQGYSKSFEAWLNNIKMPDSKITLERE